MFIMYYYSICCYNSIIFRNTLSNRTIRSYSNIITNNYSSYYLSSRTYINIITNGRRTKIF